MAHPAHQGGQAGQEGTERFPEEPQENILYFIEKNAPLLEPWQREIVRIVRKVAQYFYPQPDAGDERGLGHVLALHAAEHHVRPGHAVRRP